MKVFKRFTPRSGLHGKQNEDLEPKLAGSIQARSGWVDYIRFQGFHFTRKIIPVTFSSKLLPDGTFENNLAHAGNA